jgi:hypothetical protein
MLGPFESETLVLESCDLRLENNENMEKDEELLELEVLRFSGALPE